MSVVVLHWRDEMPTIQPVYVATLVLKPSTIKADCHITRITLEIQCDDPHNAFDFVKRWIRENRLEVSSIQMH